MAYRDFQDFLSTLEAKGELKSIDERVSPYLEITEIADRVMTKGGPALLFKNVGGTAHRFGTPDPMSAVMGHESIHPNSVPTVQADFGMPVAINTMGSRRRIS